MPNLRLMHASMQFSDTRAQHARDAKVLLDYAASHKVVFLTGTEAPSSGNHDLQDALREQAKAHGFHANLSRYGEWVMVNTSLAKVTEKGFSGPHIAGTTGLKASQGAHTPRGIAWTTATVPDVGTVTVGSVHYLTHRSIDASGTGNQALAAGISNWGKVKGAGKALVFVQGDVNMDDARRDVFMGKPFRTCWDELGKWPATHGVSKARGLTIDVSASYNSDGRVSAKSAKVLDDSDLRLATDHFPLVAVYTVR